MIFLIMMKHSLGACIPEQRLDGKAFIRDHIELMLRDRLVHQELELGELPQSDLSNERPSRDRNSAVCASAGSQARRALGCHS